LQEEMGQMLLLPIEACHLPHLPRLAH